MNETFMKERPVFPLIMSMALPMIVSMLVNSLYNIVDSFFVAQISEDAMTALSLVYPVQNLINALAIGFGVGINAAIAFFLGAGEEKAKANRAAAHGFVLSAIHGAAATGGEHPDHARLPQNVHLVGDGAGSGAAVLQYRIFIFPGHHAGAVF